MDPQLAYGLPFQSDAGRRCAVAFALAVTGTQMSQQSLLVVIGDRIITSDRIDPGVIKLGKQLTYVDAEHVGQLCNGNFRHT